jgi:hypothetical protein
MSNYTKATDFLSKDAMLTGNPLKVVRGSEIDTEFEAIQTAVATKADSATTYTKTEVDEGLSILAVNTSYNAATAAGSVVSVTSGFTLATGLAAGSVFNIYNNTAGDITITQGGGLTLRLAGTALTGNRIIATRGLVAVVVLSTSEYTISGAGIR